VAVVPEQELGPWVKALGELLGEAERYEEVSRRGREAALRFNEGLGIGAFEKYLKELSERREKRREERREAKRGAGEEVSAGEVKEKMESLTAERRALLALMLKKRKKEVNNLPLIHRRALQGPAPLSFAQQRMWFLYQLEPQSYLYNINTSIRIWEILNVVALRRAFTEIIRRHEILRTTFEMIDGQPMQLISAARPLALPLIDLTEIPEEEGATLAYRLAAEEAQRPYELTKGLLVRATLYRLGTNTGHIIGLGMHHIVSDGWSMGLLKQELAILYKAFCEDEPSPLPELELQYSDFAIWQRAWLSGEVLEKELGYWKQQLDGVSHLELPTDKTRPAVQSHRGATESFFIDKQVSDGLKRVSRQAGVTLYMNLLATFDVLLHRYTGDQDIVVGTPIAGRNLKQVEGLIGCFVNTLVMRVGVNGEMSYEELLRQVKEVALGAYAHQELPFERLVEEMAIERDLSRSPIFQVMFVMQNVPDANTDISSFYFGNPAENLGNTAKFDLCLTVDERAEGLAGLLEYNTDLFENATISRMIGHIQSLLAAIARAPQQRLSQLPLLTAGEHRQLLAVWNQTDVSYRSENCVHEVFEAQAALTPAAIALAFEDEEMTYAELNRRSNQLAHYLRTLGLGAETLVAIFLERSMEIVVAILGILKAGAAYVPLDPQYPKERLAFILQDSHAPLVITREQMADGLPGHQARILRLDSDWPEIAQFPADDCAGGVSRDNLAYVIYTSGSTGNPKGVLVTHANVTRLFHATRHWFHFADTDVWTLFHSFAFDFSVWELWGALFYGGRLVIVPYWVSRSPDVFHGLLRDQQVTVLNQTPSAFRQLSQAAMSAPQVQQTALRWVIFGGEALELQALKPWFEAHGDTAPKLVNMYGITETTVHVTWREISLRDVNANRGSVIGAPLADLQLYALDRYLQPVAIGVRGEICVGGDGVARGYLRQPELAAERFVPDPFSKQPGARLYKSGDLARHLPDGDREYLGRRDYQVKVRGFRIELGEIEATLLHHVNVREAVVIADSDKAGDKRLIAYVVCRQPKRAEIGQLRTFLKERLPEYLVPATFVFLDELPLTQNRKVDRRALPLPEAARPELDEPFAAPQSAEEKLLAGIWSSVLNIERVGVHDNFFALGGDSIRSIQVRSLAQQQGMTFSLQDLFLYQTVHDLARQANGNGAKAAAETPATAFNLLSEEDRRKLPADIEDAYPLAMLQSGMLFHSEYSQDSATYHDIFSFHLRTRFDEAAFCEAVRQLVARHTVLRTSFNLTDFSVPLQLVHASVTVPIQIDDLRHLTGDQQDQTLAAWMQSQKARHYDWTRPPLLRVQIHRRSDDTFQFTLSFHHAILDGWSVASLLTEWFKRYQMLLDGQAGIIEPPPASAFRDFVALELQALSSLEAERFWTSQLSDGPVSRLSRSGANGLENPLPPRTLDIDLPGEISDQLKALAQELGVPLKSALLAAHMSVMSMISGNKDVVTGLVTNGRPEQTDGERALGLFLNTLPFRMQLSDGSWADLIRNTFAAEGELLPFRRYPLAALQKKLGKGDLFDTVFNYTHFHVYDSLQGTGDLQVMGREGFEEANFTFTADFRIDTYTQQIKLQLVCNTLEIGDQQFGRIGEYFHRTLAAIVANPSAPRHLQCLLDDRERRQLLVEFNDTSVEAAADLCLHEIIASQAERSPDRVAFGFEHERLTYGELNDRANQLARYLRSRGVGPEMLVGMYLDRSVEVVIALLGILKAGGAYVPIDTAYPRERVGFMLANANIQVVVTRQHLAGELTATTQEIICPEIICPEITCMDTDWQRISTCDSENQINRVTTENLAYAIYTSGSTGRPKGVLVSHRAVVNHAHSIAKRFEFQPEDRVLQFSSLSFDVTGEELFPAWLMGATVVMASTEVKASLADFTEFLERHKITMVNLPSSYWGQWVSELTASRWNVPEALRLVIVGSEQTRADRFTAWQAATQGRLRLRNCYGTTETTITSTIYEPEGAVETHQASLPIGRPIANTQIYLLDGSLQLAPLGVAGELCIAGAGLARGYMGREDLTAQTFIPNPFSNEPGARLYKTGDLARYLPDGNLEIMGRLDKQVKVRGFRIELSEIETALIEHPVIAEAVVVADEDASGNQRIIAYVVAKQEARAHSGEDVHWWPSIGEYPVYDELLYTAMTLDEARNRRYQAAINQLVKDKTVVEIGTGKDALLARFCVEAGAKRVYAIEALYVAFKQAKALVKSEGLEEKIILIHGDSRNVQLPEQVDVCVSEIIGTVGSSEGVGSTINDARRFLKEDGKMIPQRCITKIAAVHIPDEVANKPHFRKLPRHYADEVFKAVGYEFDLRVCVKNLPQSHLISNADIFEDLDFSAHIEADYEREIQLTISRNSQLSGFLLWLNLQTVDGELIDTLGQEYSWLPVYFPVFNTPVEVSEGDVIEAICAVSLSDDLVHPDYKLAGAVCRKNGMKITFNYESSHHKNIFKNNGFYAHLFSQEHVSEEEHGATQTLLRSLRKHLTARLPSYMMPSAFVEIAELPLTSNGKVDRRLLPGVGEERGEAGEYEEASSREEQELVRIWEEVLGVKRVGVRDNFFEMGGDSILSIQVVARAAAAGLQISPRQMFQQQTVRELAQVAQVRGARGEAGGEEMGAVSGAARLTPIQRWFFEQEVEEGWHYNQAVMLEGRQEMRGEWVGEVYGALVEQHDALRLRFREREGRWEQEVEEGEKARREGYTEIDLREVSDEHLRGLIEAAAERVQGSLDLERGPMARLCLFAVGAGEGGEGESGARGGSRVLIVIHHLGVDGVSWRVLLEDLQLGYEQLARGEAVRMLPATLAYTRWAERLAEYAQSAELGEEIGYWQRQAEQVVGRLPVAESGGEASQRRVSGLRQVRASLSQEETRRLLVEVPGVYQTQIDEVLLSGLGEVLCQWAGCERLEVEMEGHGREVGEEGWEVSRTVGWFTSIYPVVVERREGEGVGERLKRVKEEMRRIPGKGSGYGVLKYLREEEGLRQRISREGGAEVLFNYLGQLDNVISQSALFLPATESIGSSLDSNSKRSHLIEVNAVVISGQLHMDWTYSEGVHLSSTIEQLAQSFIDELQRIIEHCRSPKAGGYTPSDFPRLKLRQKELDRLIAELSESAAE